jgi:hypothetical protein
MAKKQTEGRLDMSNGDGRNLSVQTPRAPSVVTLGPIPTIDISFLPEEQRNALMADYARGTIDIAKRAHELHVDVGVLKSTLDTLANTTREVSESGNAVTVSHTQTTKIGRTEIKMGNTDEARSGKLSKTQTGERDWNPYYIFAGIAALVLIAFLFAGRH